MSGRRETAQLIELVYRMNEYTDPETLRILDDVILLATHANPDGQSLVSNWYMREDDGFAASNVVDRDNLDGHS